MLIQTLRLKRGWSQQQLAEASGLSTRTVQRIEAGFPPSNESLKSLAAVFEVEFSTLKTEPPMNTETSARPDRDRQEAEAYRYVRKLKGFYLHLFQYIVFTSLLAILNFVTSPHYLWVFWVVFGWGLGVLMHASSVFKPAWVLGPQWEKEQVEKRLGRSL